MRTPTEFTDNINNKIITATMLDAALFSVNKRAKNHRDQKRNYKYTRYFPKEEMAEKAMYAKKEELLSVLSPVCVHREFLGYERIRVFDYETGYEEQFIEHAFAGDIQWMNYYYYHRDLHDWDGRGAYFFDYPDRKRPRYSYYLYYALPDHTYHTPITRAKAEESGLEIRDISQLFTEGHDVEDLVPVQFVDKLISLIQAGEYTYIQDRQAIIPVFEQEKRHFFSVEELLPKIEEIVYDHINIPVVLSKEEMQEIKDSSLALLRERKKQGRKKTFRPRKIPKLKVISLGTEFIDLARSLAAEGPVTIDICMEAYMQLLPDDILEQNRYVAKREKAEEYRKKKWSQWANIVAREEC